MLAVYWLHHVSVFHKLEILKNIDIFFILQFKRNHYYEHFFFQYFQHSMQRRATSQGYKLM